MAAILSDCAACSISTTERIAFRQINKATGNRLRQQLIDEETYQPVAPEHKGRGYQIAKGQYLMVEDAEGACTGRSPGLAPFRMRST